MPQKRGASAWKRHGGSQHQLSSSSQTGIQFFFGRACNATKPSLPPPTPVSAPELHKETSPLATEDPKPGSEPQKRPRLSPGTSIPQSQDDGADEIVVWKISPTADRLHHQQGASILRDCKNVSTLPKLSATGSTLRRRSSPSLAGKLEKWLLTSKPAQQIVPRCGKENDDSFHPAELHASDLTTVLQLHCQNETPSASCQQHLSVKSRRKKAPPADAAAGSGSRRKALLELLDRVQNIISVDEELPTKPSPHQGECLVTPEVAIEQCAAVAVLDPSPPVTDNHGGIEQCCNGKDHVTMSNALASIHFLVLEVTDVAYDGLNSESSPQKVLQLLNEKSEVERTAYLCDEWFYTVVRPGDTVNVIGEFDADGKCVIDRKDNLLIVHPDLLISGSRVGTSFSCARRAVLDERFTSSDFSLVALMGTMMHQLFQVGLTVASPNQKDLEIEAHVIVQKNINSLYAAGGNEKEASTRLKDAIPTILNWIDCFLGSTTSKSSRVEFDRKDVQQISISEVIDIEDMIWSPKYGLKGMIDASVATRVIGKDSITENCMMPLEFKTGKATSGQAAIEHRAQVILYTLLMSDRYAQKIDAGLLFYSFTNETKGVTIQQPDLVGLLMRRNEHSTNLLDALLTQQLPPMLESVRMCQGCWHLDVCTIYHKAQEGGTAKSSGLGDIFNERTSHLSRAHLEFLRFWDHLIDLEAQELHTSHSEIWRMPSKQREQTGRCLCCMKIDFSTESYTCNETETNHYVYAFYKDNNLQHGMNMKEEDGKAQCDSLLERPFSCGDYVVLSTESGNTAIAAGYVVNITESHIVVSLPQKLRIQGKVQNSERDILCNELWRIDKDETASFLGIMRFNLLQLFVKQAGYDQGRQLIVDLKPPKFETGGFLSQDQATLYLRSAKGLNDDQRRAIHKIISAQDYALILGMPGTGKTSTIVHAVKALLARGSSILLTSYTNSAVDNILLKLKAEGVDFIRLGRRKAIHPDVQDNCIDYLHITSVKELEMLMNRVQVVGATCLGITHPLLTNKKFDICIVDEAGQITLPVCLGPLRFANRFVLVGDHYQLPPLVRNPEAREKGLGVSLFRRLSEAHPEAICALQCQYRMCAGIMSLCNALIYGNRLHCGSADIANARLEVTCDISRHPNWLQKVLNPEHSVLFLDTDLLPAHEICIRNAIHNLTEASILLKIILALVDGGVDVAQIGVISPYNAQVEHIRRLLAAENLSQMEAHTIDRYQGRDKDCILVSFVRSSDKGSSSGTLLSDWHRINVAITRAKKKLILVGSQKTLSSTPVLSLLIKQVQTSGYVLHLPPESLSCIRRCTALNSSSQT